MLVDTHHRVIDYLRIAVTDRCNLRCVYCMPQEGIEPLPHGQILSYEEILRVARVAVGLGIRKVRLTGGEPLVRRDLERLVGALARIPGIQDLSMTTNGVLLRERIRDLRNAGLKRVNVSMDSLDPDRYRAITRGGELERVWGGIMAAMEAGMRPVKINVVAMGEHNGEEVLSFARLSVAWPVEVRFIERMPLGAQEGCTAGGFLSADSILARLRQAFSLEPLEVKSGNGPAQLYRLDKGRGTIGIIAPMTRHFCHTCNRLRLTPDGKLRTCLFSDQEMDLKGLLRSGASDQALRERILEAISRKPSRGSPEAQADLRVKKCVRPMSRIGG
jgi:cyclic pyranopterin phosphate synthase